MRRFSIFFHDKRIPSLFTACAAPSSNSFCTQIIAKPQLNQSYFNKFISECNKNGQGKEALRIYKQMLEKGLSPKTYTFVAALKACSIARDLQAGKEIHAHIIKNGCLSAIIVANSLLNMYAKCGSMEDARHLFERMTHRDVVSWSTMIMGYAQGEQGKLALQFFDDMQYEGIFHNDRTFVAALKACSSLLAQEEGNHIDNEALKIFCLDKCRAIHSQVLQSGLESNVFIASTLVDLYAKAGSMVDAYQVFEKMPTRNVVSWTALIMGYAQIGDRDMALQLFSRMQLEGIKANNRTFVAALKACFSILTQQESNQVDVEFSKLRCLEKGRAIHSQATKSGFELDIFVANTLMAMYLKCGSMIDACWVFERIPHRDVVSWNVLILGYAEENMGELALSMYLRMKSEGFTPNACTFAAALKACSSLAIQEEGMKVHELMKTECLERCRSIHRDIAISGLESKMFVANILVTTYTKCGSMVDANKVFERMPHHDVLSWSAIITGYAKNESWTSVLQLYEQMQCESCIPDARIFSATLKACGNLAEQEEGNLIDGKMVKFQWLKKGRSIHSQATKSGLEVDAIVATALIDMYIKCGSTGDAYGAFKRMPHPDVISWNAIIMGYAQEAGELALHLYTQMQHEGFIPNPHTFVAALKACGSMAAQEEGKQVDDRFIKMRCLNKTRAIHSQAVNSGFDLDIFVANTLLSTYGKCGSMVDAHWVFERMPHHNVVSWNNMIMGYAQQEEGVWVLQLYAHMQHEGFTPNAYTFVAALMGCSSLVTQGGGKQVIDEVVKLGCLEKIRDIHSQLIKSGVESDLFVASSLVDAYAKCGSMVDAHSVFERMPIHDVVSWTSIINGYAQEEGELALQLYACMQHEGFTPDNHAFAAALMACSRLASLESGKEIHGEICKAGLEHDTIIATCLIDMYCKCGSMDDAQQLIDVSSKDVVKWNALVAGYCRQGDCKRVFELFEIMQTEGLQPSSNTFVSVLTACNHTGLVDKGQMYFQVMCSECGIAPASEHFNCMVDLLGRAGQLDKAMSMVQVMPLKPGFVTWTSMLGACRQWNNVEFGRHAFDCAVRMDKQQSATYLMMTDIYGSVGM